MCASGRNRYAPSDVNWIGALVRLRRCANAPEGTYDAVRAVAHKVLDELHAQLLKEVCAVSTSRCSSCM